MPDFKKVAMLTLGIMAGNYVVDKFIVKSEANPSGWIEYTQGFGLDDVIRGAAVATVAILVTRFAK